MKRFLAIIIVFGFSFTVLATSTSYTKRSVPNLEGRTPGSDPWQRKLLWIPRILLFPVYLATEYVIRWPLNSFGSYAERHQLASQLASIFTFGEKQQYSL